MCSRGGSDSPRAYLDDQFTYVREDHRLTVLKSTVVGKNVYYAACERVAVADGARIVFAVVCLVRYTPRARDGYIFAYKDMDETVGPCASKCPASILSLLTPTESQWANAWRARCRSEEHTSELQSLMRISYAVFCLKKKKTPLTLINT